MELIDRYVYAVTRALPKAQRQDVEKELRSDIHDMIEAEQGAENERVRKVLETLGRPETLALNYSGAKQYLIGPKWYGLYIEMLKKIGFVAVPVLFVIHLLAHALKQDVTVAQAAAEVIGNTINGAIQVVFWTTAVFVFFEHSRSREMAKEKEKMLAWSVDNLPQLPPERQTKLSDNIANIVFYGMLIFVALLTKNVLGFDVDGKNVSFFNPDLWTSWLPVMVAILIGFIAKEVAVLKKGHETIATIWAKIGLDAALFGILAGLYLKDMLINPAFAEKTQGIWIGDVSLDWIVGATLVLWGVGFVWDTIASLLKLRRTR